MKKRLFAAALSLMLLLSMAVPTALAEEGDPQYTGPTMTVTTSATEVHPGDVIDCSIVMGPVEDLLIMAAALDLSDGLTFVSGSGQLPDGLQEKLGFDSLFWDELNYKGESNLLLSGYGVYGDYSSTEDTLMLTFQCQVDDDAEGELSIGLTRLEFYCGSFASTYQNVTDTVTVVPAEMTVEIPVTGVTVTPTSMTLRQGESAGLDVTVAPENATNQAVTYSSSDSSVATVDDSGTVTAVSEGQATITVTTADGAYTATCVVTVPHEHTYGDNWVYDDTEHWRECTAGDGARTDVGAHSGGSATCEALAVCEVCGASYGDYAAHTLVRTEAVEADHFHPGNIEYWTCSVCGKVFSDAEGNNEISLEDTVIPQIPHDYGTDWVYDDEQHWHECGCGNIIDAADHTMEWVTDQEPTEEETGLQHEECTVCGYTRNLNTVIPKLEHELTHHDAVAATCVSTGNVAYYSCANCGRYFADAEATQVLDTVETPIDPDNHTGETELRDAVAAACTQDGYSGDLYCAGCGVLLENGNVIPATGHTLERVEAVEATHFAPGNIEYWQCTVCGALFSDGEGANEISAEDTVIPQIPHTFGEAWFSDGSGHWHECECGVQSDVEAHIFGEWTTTKEATETETGSRERTCSICGYVETETLAALTPGSGTGSGSGSGANDGGAASGSGDTAPQTGDNSLIGLCLAAMAVSGAGLAALVVVNRKKRGNR